MSHDVIVVSNGSARISSSANAPERMLSRLVHGARARRRIDAATTPLLTPATFYSHMVHHGADDIKKSVLGPDRPGSHNTGRYVTAEQYFDDLGRITQYHSDPELADVLIHSSADTVR